MWGGEGGILLVHCQLYNVYSPRHQIISMILNLYERYVTSIDVNLIFDLIYSIHE